MKRLVNNYTFNATAKTLTFNRPDFGNNIDLTRVLLITDITTGSILYQFNGTGTAVSGNVLTFVSLPGAVSSSDTIQIIYDFADPEPGRLTFPDTNVLWDDTFNDGMCAWEETNVPLPTTWAIAQMPLTLGTDGHFGRYALRMTNANVSNSFYGGYSSAMKRGTHQAQVGVTNKGIVKAEYWFTYGSDGSTSSGALYGANTAVSAATYVQISGIWYVTLTVASVSNLTAGTFVGIGGLGGLTNCNGTVIIQAVNSSARTITYIPGGTPSGTYTSGGTVSIVYDFVSPAFIGFFIDEQLNMNITTSSARVVGNRCVFAAEWRQSLQNGSSQPYYSGQWYLTNGSSVPYGQSGYVAPGNGVTATGYYSDFAQNMNKRNLHYVAIIVDCVNGNWIGIQANDQYIDLTRIPANGNNPLNSLLSPLDPTYNLQDFGGGLNQYATIKNISTGGVGNTWGTASWMELHRTRMSYL